MISTSSPFFDVFIALHESSKLPINILTNKYFFYFVDVNDIIEAEIRKIDANLWECLKCGKTATTKHNLKKHIETHFDLTYPCQFCPKICPTSNALNAHMFRSHKSEK